MWDYLWAYDQINLLNIDNHLCNFTSLLIRFRCYSLRLCFSFQWFHDIFTCACVHYAQVMFLVRHCKMKVISPPFLRCFTSYKGTRNPSVATNCGFILWEDHKACEGSTGIRRYDAWSDLQKGLVLFDVDWVEILNFSIWSLSHLDSQHISIAVTPDSFLWEEASLWHAVVCHTFSFIPTKR